MPQGANREALPKTQKMFSLDAEAQRMTFSDHKRLSRHQGGEDVLFNDGPDRRNTLMNTSGGIKNYDILQIKKSLGQL